MQVRYQLRHRPKDGNPSLLQGVLALSVPESVCVPAFHVIPAGTG